MEKEELLKKMYAPVFNHFAEVNELNEEIVYDSSWENSTDSEISNRFIEAMNDGLLFKNARVKMENFQPIEIISRVLNDVHKDYCENELKSFYERVKKNKENGYSILECYEIACYLYIDRGSAKNNVRNNYFDKNLRTVLSMPGNYELFNNCLNSYDDFKKVVNYEDDSLLKLKHYVKSLAPVAEKDVDYIYINTSRSENILVDYNSLSDAFKKPLIAAATSAYDVYYELSKAGLSIDEMRNSEELVGIGMNVNYLRNTMSAPVIKYTDLDFESKDRNKKMFNRLLEIVEKNKDLYKIEPVDGYEIPNYPELEEKIEYSINNQVPLPLVEKKDGELIVQDASDAIKSISKNKRIRGYGAMWFMGLASGLFTASLIGFAAYFLGR